MVLEAMEPACRWWRARVSGIPEVVVDGETGWLVPPEDPEALAAALGEVLADPAEARRRGEAGREAAGGEIPSGRRGEAWRAAVLAARSDRGLWRNGCDDGTCPVVRRRRGHARRHRHGRFRLHARAARRTPKCRATCWWGWLREPAAPLLPLLDHVLPDRHRQGDQGRGQGERSRSAIHRGDEAFQERSPTPG